MKLVMAPFKVDAPPHALKDSNVSSKVKTTEEAEVGVHSLTCNTSGVEGHAKTPGWGLGRVTSGSITHTNLHNPNNRLVSAWLEHFWCSDETRTYMDS